MKKNKEFELMQSYIDENRNKLDEALVSLRFMKKVDDFLTHKNLTNKELAERLGYTESYISQLMTGTKNINVSFINKFEKKSNSKFLIELFLNDEQAQINADHDNRFLTFNQTINFIFVEPTTFKVISTQGNNVLLDVVESVN